MSNVRLIASHTFRQVIRQKAFLNVGLFGLGMVILAVVVASLTYGDPARVVRSIGLSGVVGATDLLAILLGASLIYRDIEDKTLYIIFARPVHRWQYLLGRHLGLFAASALVLVGFSLCLLVAMAIGGDSFSIRDVKALLAALGEVSFMAAVGLSISTVMAPSLGVGVGLSLWVAAASADDLQRLMSQQKDAVAPLLETFFSLLPQLVWFDLRSAAVHGFDIAMSQVAIAWLYGALYTIAFLGLGLWMLSRREFH